LLRRAFGGFLLLVGGIVRGDLGALACQFD